MNKINIFTLSIILSPIQFIFIPIGGSQFDFSTCIQVLSIIFYSITQKIYWSKFTFFSIYIYFFTACIIFAFNPFPFSRFISGSFFLLFHALFLTCHFKSSNFLPEISDVRKILTNFSIILGLLAILQKIIYPIDRPDATFVEPSAAGLFFVAYICSEYCSKDEVSIGYSNKERLALLISSIGLALTMSLHIFSGIGSVLIYKLLKLKIKYKFTIKTVLSYIFISILFAIFIGFNFSHIITRINFSGELNLSQLAWLQGASQAIFALKNSPIFGFGPGSIGTFEINNIFYEKLDLLGFPNLNKLDGYSGLFRLTVETGLIGISFLFIRLLNVGKLINSAKLFLTNNNKIEVNINYSDLIFTTIFGLTIFLGILLKESVWSRSFYPLCIILLFLLPQKFKNQIYNENT